MGVSLVILWLLIDPASSAPPAKGPTIYVFRPSSFDSWARTVVVGVDGLATAELGNCAYARLSLPIGEHLISVAMKPWPLDKPASLQPLEISLGISDAKNLFLGYYPSQLSAAEISSTFISYRIAKDRYPQHFGTVHADVATKAMLECTEVKALHE